MHFQIVCLLLAAYCCHNGSGRVLIKTNTTQSSAAGYNETAVIDLPPGFKPQAPPVQPLLYPFATETSESRASTSGWKPIVNTINVMSSTQRTITPLVMMEDRLSDGEMFPSDHPTSPSTIMEAIVYGAWKPQPPLKPDEITNSESNENHSYDSLEAIPNKQYSDSIDRVSHKHHMADMDVGSADLDYTDHRDQAYWEKQDINKQPKHKSFGRRKFLAKNMTKTIEDYQIESTTAAHQIIKVDINDPNLLAVAKEINHSVEKTSTKSRWPAVGGIAITAMPPTQATSEGQNEMALTSTETTKNWPTDFIAFANDSYTNNVSEPPALVPDILLPQIGLNITKMGVPYEDRNVADDSTRICVPLTISEKSPSNHSVESEQIYCFPLPAPDVVERGSNDTEAKASIDYEAVQSSSSKLFSTCRIIIYLYLFHATKNLLFLHIR